MRIFGAYHRNYHIIEIIYSSVDSCILRFWSACNPDAFSLREHCRWSFVHQTCICFTKPPLTTQVVDRCAVCENESNADMSSSSLVVYPSPLSWHIYFLRSRLSSRTPQQIDPDLSLVSGQVFAVPHFSPKPKGLVCMFPPQNALGGRGLVLVCDGSFLGVCVLMRDIVGCEDRHSETCLVTMIAYHFVLLTFKI